jgi:putative exporter of polyketide antibiotics
MGRYSPFRYYSALDILMSDKLPVRSVVVLLAVTATAAAFAFMAYRHRDL